MLEVTKTGDWDAVSKMLGGMKTLLREAGNDTLTQMGLEAEARAVKHISSQDLDWQPLKPRTISAKIRRGESTLILVASDTYRQSITSWVDKAAGVAYAGVRRRVRYPSGEGGETVATIARALEYGVPARNLPPRPLWVPTHREVAVWANRKNLAKLNVQKRLSFLLR